MAFSNAPNFDGLADLGRRDGIDIRPVLVRVLTDLYVQKPRHTAEEERNYVELMLRFIGMTDVATRANVARKLAGYDGAPLPVIQRLARDIIEVAEPILQQSTQLSPADLVSIADCGPQHAAAITARRRADIARRLELARPVKTLASAGSLLAASACTPAAEPDASGGEAGTERASETPKREPQRESDADLSRRFLQAGSAERRDMLSALEREAETASQGELAAREHALSRLETAALQRKPDAFALELESALAVSHILASRIVADPGGEPLLVALKALGMPSNVLLRVLLFLNPAIGQSVERVFDLARLYDRLAPIAARRLVAGMRLTHPAERRPAGHQPVHAPDPLTRVRDAFASAARRASGQPPAAAPAEDRHRRQGTT